MNIRDFDSLFELLDYFNTEEKCIDYLAKVKWNGSAQCPYCASDKAYRLKTGGKNWKCNKCRKQFSVRVGTIFEDSRIELRKWFVAIYLITAHKKGDFFTSISERHKSYSKKRMVYVATY
ncbi:transposase [Mariniflexile sp. HNIBRBA6329]|uniref:transposase n=1 Tax=Mariniflexile sp. HNIBRBA6329 TaxID=3373088 RepID=UPI003745A967